MLLLSPYFLRLELHMIASLIYIYIYIYSSDLDLFIASHLGGNMIWVILVRPNLIITLIVAVAYA